MEQRKRFLTSRVLKRPNSIVSGIGRLQGISKLRLRRSRKISTLPLRATDGNLQGLMENTPSFQTAGNASVQPVSPKLEWKMEQRGTLRENVEPSRMSPDHATSERVDTLS